MVFTRYYQPKMLNYLRPGRVLVLFGPRRVGKTFLIQEVMKSYRGKIYSGVGEDATLQEILESNSVERLKGAFSGYDLIVIDEAQKVQHVGQALKMLADHLPQARVMATGSSSFELASEIGEPLTGRKRTLTLFPLSILELKEQLGPMALIQILERLLIYGSYPETLSVENDHQRKIYLSELKDAYLYKDILELEQVKNSKILMDLLTLLAFQIGKEVSHSELGNSLMLSKQTVARYLDLLEKAFVIRCLRGFSRNLRKEVSKKARYYFLDNGVRNAVINNFNALSRRDDIGALWENFIVMERLKRQHYKEELTNHYFWRTHDRQEIDLIEERDGELFGYEIGYSPKKSQKAPRDWLSTYPKAHFSVITKENFVDFLT